MAHSIQLKLKPNNTIHALLKNIEKKFQVKKIKSKTTNLIFLDTFDWRLYRNNYILIYDGFKLQLENYAHPKRINLLQSQSLPVFINDFPDGNLKNKIKKIIQIRALQTVCKITIIQDSFNFQDDNAKTIMRMRIDSINRVGKFVFIDALRGYENQLEAIRSPIKSNTEPANPKIIFDQILKLNKKKAANYDPRINVNLQPQMRSDFAVKMVLKNLVATMLKNEQGIIKNVDTEFLHDFRVATRRTRAALTQIKNVFDQGTIEKFNKQFTTVGKKTNKLRDLEVYLLNKSDYIARLPNNMQNDIEPFFAKLEEERISEHGKFTRYLKSEQYKSDMKAYLKFLDTTIWDDNPAANASKPIKILASEFIVSRYNKVIKAGNQINPESPDGLYHRLRIQCKKLRYLLEFFSSLFDQEKITLLISQLKKLQDNLGLFNDLFVQQETLKEYSKKAIFNTNTVLALGYLIGKLNDEQSAVRNSFHKILNGFTGNQNQFKNIFLINEDL